MLHHQMPVISNGSVTLLSELSPDLEPNDAKKVQKVIPKIAPSVMLSSIYC